MRVGAMILGLSLALASAPAAAQAPPAAPEKIAIGDWLFAPSLQLRLRGEYRHDAADLGGRDFTGRLTPRVRDAWIVMERARVGLGVERGPLRAQVTLQDARALGSPSPDARVLGTRGLGIFAPYEAFAEAHGSGARPHYARLGRQAVVWGEGRLVGSADFAPAGRSLDAARGHLAFGNLDLEALAALLEFPTPAGAAFGDTAGDAFSGTQLFGVNAKLAFDPLLKIEAYGLARVARSRGGELDGSRFAASRLSGERFTGALRVSGEGRGWGYGAEGAYQFGTASAVGLGGSDIAAWAAAAHVEKTFAELVLSPTIRVQGSYASGDDGRGKYKQFDPLLPDPQRFHGQMDLFAWSNLMDLGGQVQVVPLAETKVAVSYRYARLAEARGEWVGAYTNAIGSAFVPPLVQGTPPAVPVSDSRELGHELGFNVAWRPLPPFELRAGWSGLVLGDGAKGILRAHDRGSRTGAVVSPGEFAQYSYLQATLDVP